MTRTPALLLLAATPTLANVAPDPRPAILELSLAGQHRPALLQLAQSQEREPERARALGLDLLRADLLDRLGREREASEALAQMLASESGLGPWARLRLATLQDRQGHPEVAAGLVAHLLSASAPDSLRRPALALLGSSIAQGGDCRLLGGVAADRIPADRRRAWTLLQAQCLLRQGDLPTAARMLRELLADDVRDALALDAADLLEAHVATPQPSLLRLLGLTAFHHREFDRALRLLPVTAGQARLTPQLGEVAYARARSLYWLGKYELAAEAFDELAARAPTVALAADALCQAGRSFELAGRGADALARFRAAWEREPDGSWAPSALSGALRLEAAFGNRDAARTLLGVLTRTPGASSATARAALFLAVGELERSRTQGVAALLLTAQRTGAAEREELAYWRGRLAELESNHEIAVAHYLDAQRRRPYHPLAVAARRRLARAGLAEAARRLGEAAAGRAELASRRDAVLLLGEADPLGQQARLAALAELSSRRATAVWIDWQPVPVADWPLWTAPASRPEDLLAGLGLLAEAGDTTVSRFPASDLRLAFTGAQALAADERSIRRALARAESLFERRPADLPFDWIDPQLRRLLYPFPWARAIRAQAEAFRTDPALLAAILREESRFDPEALSPAAARGLAQFTLPTAQRLAQQTRLAPDLTARQLHDPAIAIPLAAAYLAELDRRFPRSRPVAVAAYNAGEDQAALWRRYCVTGEPEEFLARIGYAETKAYVVRVLESREIYRALYGSP